MDEFLKDIQYTIFQKWVSYHHFEQCSKVEQDGNFTLETTYGIGHINFYEDCIIELNVENKMSHEVVFFIHFQMNNFHHALGLLEEMTEQMLSLVVHSKTKILLSCSSGFTTAFFSDKLNEAGQLLNKDYEFNAVAYSELFDVAKNYDMILLAPQVSYMESKVKDILKYKIVTTIPTQLFGKYDVEGTFEFIDQQLKIALSQKISIQSSLPIKHELPTHGRILCISFLQRAPKIRMVSRLYDQDNTILVDYEMYKSKITLDEIIDMIDIILFQHENVDIISIALPGVVYHGTVTLCSLDLDIDIVKSLNKKYDQKIVVNNDVNTIVTGYYATQDDYHSIAFLFQPYVGGNGGVGFIHDGHLLKGHHNVAGEIKYLPIAYSKDYENNKNTPEGAIEWISKNSLAITSLMAPDAIIVANKLVSSLDDVRKQMAEVMPEEYIPDLIRVQSLKEFIFIGCIILGLK